MLIPSLSPDERLPAYVRELLNAGFGLALVVDDGSAAEYQPIFDEIAALPGCEVLHHEVNRGKGAALRTGYAYIQAHTELRGIITADSDGQHTVPDTLNLAAKMDGEEALLLGSRDFSRNSVQVPPKSRLGNRITSFVFRVLYGHWLPDTQTGLRAFPRELLDFMLSVGGDRFEYEMNVLISCAERKVPMIAVPIQTVYHDENKGTHFHPIRDSWRIYKLLLGSFFRFMWASVIAMVADQLLFWLLCLCGLQIFPATAVARVCSATLNFLLNKAFVFQLKECKGAAWRYILLCVCVMIVSGTAVNAFTKLLGWHPTPVKIIVDTLLFFLNYRIQKAWVFPAETSAAK